MNLPLANVLMITNLNDKENEQFI